MAKHSIIELLRGRRIELRNLLRNRPSFGTESQQPIPWVQRIGIFIYSILVLCLATVFIGMSVFVTLKLIDRFGRGWGVAAAVAMFALTFSLAWGFLSFISKKIQRAIAEIPPTSVR